MAMWKVPPPVLVGLISVDLLSAQIWKGHWWKERGECWEHSYTVSPWPCSKPLTWPGHRALHSLATEASAPHGKQSRGFSTFSGPGVTASPGYFPCLPLWDGPCSQASSSLLAAPSPSKPPGMWRTLQALVHSMLQWVVVSQGTQSTQQAPVVLSAAAPLGTYR